MRPTRTLALAALFIGSIGLVACDSDGDGLSNSEEKKLGTDKDLVDSDGDGIEDGAEVDQGLSPLLTDSDGDGFDDNVELEWGTDPTNGDERPYLGGWPLNHNKDAISDPGLDSQWAMGQTIPRLVLKDQFRDDVDLYDFAFQGKKIVIDVSAQWCPPCQEMADWLEGGPSGFSAYNPIRRAVNDGDVIWITILAEDSSYQPARARTCEEWDAAYPNENIAVLADRQYAFTQWMELGAYPTTMLLNEDLTIAAYDPEGNNLAALDALMLEL